MVCGTKLTPEQRCILESCNVWLCLDLVQVLSLDTLLRLREAMWHVAVINQKRSCATIYPRNGKIYLYLTSKKNKAIDFGFRCMKYYIFNSRSRKNNYNA